MGDINYIKRRCNGCYLNWKASLGCEAFLDKSKPFLNEKGECIAKITDIDEYKKHEEYFGLQKAISKNPNHITSNSPENHQ